VKKITAIIILVLVVTLFIQKICGENNSPQSFVHGAWLWNTALIEDEDKINELVSFGVTNNIKTIYLQIKRKIDTKYYKRFISLCSKNGIEVHALGGSPNFIYYEENDQLNEFFSFLREYNEKALEEEKIKGIHLDVEPYLLSDWASSKESIVEVYQNYIIYALAKSEELSLLVNFDLPFWFDEVYYTNSHGEGYLAEWIIKKTRNITIMAYRNNHDDIIRVVDKEIEWSKKYGTVIFIACELTPQKESKVTFYGHSNEYWKEEMNKVIKNYSDVELFISVHDIIELMKNG